MNAGLFAALLLAPLGGFASVPAYAQNDAGDMWVRSAPAKASYSIETPCSQGKVREQSSTPLVINGRPLDVGTNVTCVIGEASFSSGVISVPADEIGTDKIFDVVMELLADETVRPEVQVQTVNVGGRRALLSREIRGKTIAQTGVIELSNREMLMLVSGGSATDDGELAAMIDRHVASLEVVQK